MSNSSRPHGLHSPWNSPGQNTGVGSLFLLQETSPTQGSNPGLSRCRQILYQLSHQGNPRISPTRYLMFYLPSSLNIPQISRLEGDCFLGLGYLGIIPCFLESFSFFVKYTSYVKPFVNSVVNFHVTLRPRFQQPANFVSSAFTSSCPVGRPPVYTSAFYVEWKVPEGWVMTRSPFVSPLSGTPYVLGVCTIVYL